MYLLVESDGADAVHSMGQHGVAASVPCCAHDTGSFVPARGHVLLYEIWMAQVRCLHGAIDSFGDERTIFRLPFDLVGYAVSYWRTDAFLVQGPKTGIYVPFAGKNRYTLGPSKTHTANPALGQTHALWRYYILSDCVALPEKGGVLPFRRHAQTLDTRRLPQTLDVCYTYSARHVGTRKRRFVVDNGMQSFFPHILGSRAALLANDHSSQVTVIQGVQDVLYIPVLHSIVSM